MAKVRKKRIENPIDDNTQEFSVGSITLDCVQARSAGWTDKMLNRVAVEISRIGRREGSIAARRKPQDYIRSKDGVLVFLGGLSTTSRNEIRETYGLPKETKEQV